MEIGLSLGICRGGRVAAFTPGSLTGLAATVLPAESLAAGLLWQDTAKTIAATADGDPVRVAVCPYTSVEFTAPSDAARPLLYEEGGGAWSLMFDGVDDSLLSSSRAWLPAKRGGFFLRATNTASGFGTVASTYIGTAPDFQLGLRGSGGGSGTMGFYDGISTDYFGSSVLTGWRTWGLVRSADTTTDAYLDTTTAVSATCANNQHAANTLSIGNVKVAADVYSGRLAGWVAVDLSPSAADITEIWTYLTALAS